MRSETTDTDLVNYAKRFKIPLVFIGNKDQLPNIVNPGGYIVNLANHDKDGTHWVSLFISPSRDAFYFDSFGADIPENILHFLAKGIYAKKIHINPYDIQNIKRGFCGEYDIDFLYHIMQNPTIEGFNNFLHKFQLFKIHTF